MCSSERDLKSQQGEQSAPTSALSIIAPRIVGIGAHLSRHAVRYPSPTCIEVVDPEAGLESGPDWGALMPPLQIKSQIEHVVAVAFAVTVDDLQRPSRGRAEAAFARQVAMYLAHVCCHWTFTEVGRLFNRDRTTVAHACALVEDHRDDPRLDRAIEWLERVVKRLAEPWRLEPGAHAEALRPGCNG